MIAVTCASGQTGRAVLAALERADVAARPFVRRPHGLAGETVVDVREPEPLAAALRGVTAVYHLAPNMDRDEERMGAAVIAAAAAAGVERVVFHSVLRPQLRAMPHHIAKLRVEEALAESPLRWTVLQPGVYRQSLTGVRDGVLRVPFSLDARFSPVDLDDVAEVAVHVLTTPGHDYAVYELAGPDLLSVRDIAASLGVRAERQALAAWDRDAAAAGMSAEVRAGFAAMWRFYDCHGLVGNPAVLRMLLDRAPAAVGAEP